MVANFIQFDEGFKPTIFECIDRALVKTLGIDVAKALYFYMLDVHKMSDDQLQQRPTEVIQHLKEMLGESGFRALERAINSEIRARFEIN